MAAHSESPLSAVESALRATGARVTRSRVRVLDILLSAQGPCSHGDIEAQLSKDAQPGIDRVTLYRVLEWLTEAGLAHKAADARGVFRFSAAKPSVAHAQHMHFHCTDCGRVFCLDAPAPSHPVLPEGFLLTAMETDIRGKCPGCADGPPPAGELTDAPR